MRKLMLGLVVVMAGAALMLSGCSKAKEQAEEALKAAESAWSGVKAEAAKIVPDQVKSVESALNSAKDKLAKKDYKTALTEAQAIPGKVKDLTAAMNAKKQELTKIWTDLSQGVPKMVEAIKSRVDILSKSKKLPANLTKEKFDEVKSGLETALKDWGQASESFKAGGLADAIGKANAVKEKAAQMLQTLGMPVPPAAKS
jgi:hypothetical protein